jgi:hypothetical protein
MRAIDCLSMAQKNYFAGMAGVISKKVIRWIQTTGLNLYVRGLLNKTLLFSLISGRHLLM